MIAFGLLLWAGAAFFLLGALGMDTSVQTEVGVRVHNIGLLGFQQMGIYTGIGLFIGGAIFIAVGSRNASTKSVESAGAADTKACPFCAETVKRAAIVCKHCGKDLQVAPKLDSDDGYGDRVISEGVLNERIRALQAAGYRVEGPYQGPVNQGWIVTHKTGAIVRVPTAERLIDMANGLGKL